MSTEQPLITTIIATYRRPALVQRAIRSVLAQTYRNFQLYVYDNASGDETGQVVSELARQDSRIKYYCHPNNIGATANFNYGIAQVETPFFSVLSDDDVLLPEFYEETLSGFRNFPDAMFSAGSVITISDQGHVLIATLSSWKRDGYFTPPEGVMEIAKGNHPIINGILFRREVIDVFKGLDPNIVAADLDLELRVAARFPYVVSRKPTALFVCHPSSIGMSANSTLMWPSFLKIMENLQNDDMIASDTYAYAERFLTGYFQKMLLIFGLRSAIRGDFLDTIKSADILRTHYQAHSKAFILAILSKSLENIKAIHTLARFCFNIAKFMSRVKNRRLQKEFGSLARFLQLEEVNPVTEQTTGRI